MAWLIWRYVGIVARERMVTRRPAARHRLLRRASPAFVLMLLRAIQVFVGNIRRGYSVLERPDAFDGLGD